MAEIMQNLQHGNYGYCGTCGLRYMLLVKEVGVSTTYPQEGYTVYDHKVVCSNCDQQKINRLEKNGWFVIGW